MARISFGALVSDVRGKVDGILFSRGPYGAFVKKKHSPVNKKSPLQSSKRNLLAICAKAFSNLLTPIQRLSWETLAARQSSVDVFGKDKTLSGRDLYIQFMSRTQSADQQFDVSAPVDMFVPSLDSMSITAQASDQTIRVSFAPLFPIGEIRLFIYSTGVLNPGVLSYSRRLSFLAYTSIATHTPFNIQSFWIEKYGPILEGSKIGFRVHFLDFSNGALSVGLGQLVTVVEGVFEWTERQPAGDVSKAWRSVASDSDGSNLIAAVFGGRLYTSSTGGVSWIERQPAGDVNQDWRSVASDSDGSNLVAVVADGRLYTSSNGGVSWIERQPAGDVNQDWFAVASDSDGSNLIASVFGGRLYTSSDGGVSWIERQPAGDVNRNWRGVASNSDGSNLISGIDVGRLYTHP
jgi:hypothetical protein